MSALVQSADSFHEGYLYLRVGKSVKSSRLQRSWAVLKFESADGQRRIDFYDPKHQHTAVQKPTMSLPISDTLGVKADVPARGFKQKYPFLVLTTTTKYQLFTESEEDRKKWMGRLYQLLYGPPIQGRVYEYRVQVFPTKHSTSQELDGQYVLRLSNSHLSLYSYGKGQQKTKFNCPLLQVDRTQQGTFPNQSDQYSPFADQSSTVTCLVLQTTSNSPLGFGVFVFCTQSAQEISTIITHRKGQLMKERGCASPTSQSASPSGHVSLNSSLANNSLDFILEDSTTNSDRSRYITTQSPQPRRAQPRDSYREETHWLQKPMIRSISHSTEALSTTTSKGTSLLPQDWWEEKDSAPLRPSSPQFFQRVASAPDDDTHTAYTPPPATQRISPIIALPSTPGRSLDVSEDLWDTGTFASDSESDTEDIEDGHQDEYFDDRAEFAVIQHRFPSIEAAAKSQTFPLSSPQVAEEPLYANYHRYLPYSSPQNSSREQHSYNTPKRPLPLPRPKQRSSLPARDPQYPTDTETPQKQPPLPPAPAPRIHLTMGLDREEPSQPPKSLVSPPRLRKPLITTPPQRDEIPIESNQHFPEYQNARALREAPNLSLAKLTPSITEQKTPRPTPRKRKPPTSSPSPQAKESLAMKEETGHENGYERVPMEPYERVPSQASGQRDRYERVKGSASRENIILNPPRKSGRREASFRYERVPPSSKLPRPSSGHIPGGMRLHHSVSYESIPQFYEDFYEFRKRWLVARDTGTHTHSQAVATATEQSPQQAPPVLSDDDDQDYQSAVQSNAPIIHAYEKVWNRKSTLRKSLSAEDLYTVSLTMAQQERERSVFVEGEEADDEDYDYPYQWEGMEGRNIYDSPTDLQSPTYEKIPNCDTVPEYSPQLHPSSYIHTEMPLPPSFPASLSRTLSFFNSGYSQLKRPAPLTSLPNTQNSSTTNNYFIFMIAPDKWKDLYMPSWTDPLHAHTQTPC